MIIRVGILSDTHLVRPDSRFKKQVRHCFQGCDMIIHAGDLTNPSILEVFLGIQIVAVHGNMCGEPVRTRYPARQLFALGRFTIGLTHGADLGPDIENALFDIFPEADCMIYGHTPRPSIQYYGDILMLNPGSFQATSRYGTPGTYAILEAGEQLSASIHEIPSLL
ncbi:MAG: metallophosphoesterase family protein [Desulfobulbus sp.]